MKHHRLLPLALLLAACVRHPPAPPAEDPRPQAEPVLAAAPPVEAPAMAREFRGVWVASVGNIDWPSRRGLSTEQQKAELVALLDRAAELRLNAVIFQVRPAGDALYASELEPWSEYLTGTMGKAPEPFYDPLAFAIEEAHRRGLELHAWFNPFRARHPSGRSAVDARHISRTQPALMRRYGSQLWMEPGDRRIQDHSMAVVLDVVRRYDVDGVHIDDYFYPYREERAGKTIPFPDDDSYARYRASGGRLERGDWRRDNVNRFVERLYGEVKATKPWVRVGISPFGIWRPGYPAQVWGLDSYHEIFADSRRWLQNGWLDYLAPQLYWPIRQRGQEFPVLLNWWASQNAHGRHLWPGAHANRVENGKPSDWPVGEIAEQVLLTRAHPEATGVVLFSAQKLLRRPNQVSRQLGEEVYREHALVPATPWLGGAAPAAPRVELRGGEGGAELELRPGEGEPVWLWAVRSRSGERWTYEVLPGWRREHTAHPGVEQVVVTAVSRLGAESVPVAASVADR